LFHLVFRKGICQHAVVKALSSSLIDGWID
jgi:hypothetical protein